MTREDPQVKVRLPPALKEKVEALATERRTSINAVVVDILEKYEALLQEVDSARWRVEVASTESETRRRQQERAQRIASEAQEQLRAQEALHREEVGALKEQLRWAKQQVPTALMEEMQALRSALTEAQMATFTARNKALSASLVIARLAELIDPAAVKAVDPELASTLESARQERNQLLHQGAMQMLRDVRGTIAILNEGLTSGRLRVIDDDGNEIPPDQVRTMTLPPLSAEEIADGADPSAAGQQHRAATQPSLPVGKGVRRKKKS